MTEDEYQNLAATYLTMLMRRDAAAWHRAMYFDDSGPAFEKLEPEQRRFLHRLRRVTHQKREDEA
jgi:hypothetical protein